MAFSKITHHMGRIPETQQYKIDRITPIVQLKQYNEIVLLQGGQFYTSEGQVLKEVPGWAYIQMGNLTPRTLEEAGFKEVPKPRAGTVLETKIEQGMWQCPECGKTMDERNQAGHLAKHAKHRVVQPTATAEQADLH